MTWETFPCCCATGPCCPCNPFYGFNTSYRVTWNGSLGIDPNLDCDCVCLSSTPGPFGTADALMYVGAGFNVTNRSFVSTWLNTTNPIAANFCSMTSYDDLTMPKVIFQRWFCFQGTCGPFPGYPRETGPRIQFKMELYPPQRFNAPGCITTLAYPSGYTRPWKVRVLFASIIGLVFDGGFDCIPGPFALNMAESNAGGVPLVNPYGVLPCTGSANLAAGTVGYIAGSVTVK